MKFPVAISVAVLFGLAAAQTTTPVNEDVHLAHSNRTAKFLDSPDPVLKLFKPILMEKVTDYGNQLIHWFNTLDKSSAGLPLMFVGIVGIAVSLALTVVSAVGLGTLEKSLKPAASPDFYSQPLPMTHGPNRQVDTVAANVFKALSSFQDQKNK